ncbi:MAG: prepilin-type N-terminal cleavage/methylation domain-containing protein [Patescibacteria group bacterium]|mgnify:CR=1 FL=1
MKRVLRSRGFTLIEILVSISVFLIFAVGIYGGLTLIFKIVYQSRLRILETAILSEELETVRNFPFNSVGIISGVPAGLLPRVKTITRNGMTFDIITTVRNIDDPFDGMATGTPTHDTSPADYKLVEMSINSRERPQVQPVILSTMVAPKGLEGASENGALFIQVFNADGLPVAGANAHITRATTTIDDTTGNDGWLRIVDTPTGTMAYNITVSKNGYSTDYTLAPSATNTSPAKLPSNVASQMVTEISFSIDWLANLNIHTLNPDCSAKPSVSFNLHSSKKIGLDPVIYKYDQNLTTNGSGNLSLTNMEWDRQYAVSASGMAYDLAGSIPFLPLNLAPDSNQELTLILRPKTTHSLLVGVADAGTGLPLSAATVRLIGTGYDENVVTGVGYMRQTDWSGGSGQSDFIFTDRYFSDDGNLDINSPVGDLKLKKVGQNYVAGGYLESSTFDLGSAVDFHNIIWTPTIQPSETGDSPILVQLAASNTTSPASWDFVGPNGAADAYYTVTSTLIYNGHDGQRYLRYRLYLSTADTRYTPQFSEIAFTYTNGCIPPGQAFFNSLSAGTYTLEVSRSGYTPSSDTLDVAGATETTVNLSTTP